MKLKYQRLQREQLDRKLKWLSGHRSEFLLIEWIRSIREALSMTTYQLARRIGVAQSTLAEWEAREKDGTLSVATLRKIAVAMECDLVYAFVPHKKLRTLMEDQAVDLATRIVDDVGQSMKLEGQQTSPVRRRSAIKEQAKLLLDDSPGRIWDGWPKQP